MSRMLLLFLICCSFLVRAQEPSLYFEKLTTQNGLSHNKINCIIQDKRGFIWIGTDDGLNRYDGKRFLQFHSRLNDSTTISGNIITDLFEDKEGKIWIATSDGGLSCYDHRMPPSQQFRQYKHQPRNPLSIPVNGINAMLEDPAGYIWIGTSGRSILRFNKKTGRFDDITKGRRTILDLCFDKEGMIWVGRQGGGLMKVNPTTLFYAEDDRYRDLYAKLPHVTITSLFKDSEGHIWFGSWDKILYKQNAVTGKEEQYQNGTPYSFPNDEAISFAEDKWGRIWIGGKEKGLHVYDKRTNRFYNYSYNPSQEGGIADNRINCIFFDRQGRVWLGTTRGICINNPEKQQFAQHFLNGKTHTPITVYDFFEEDGMTWIGTSAGIFVKGKDGTLTQRIVSYKGTPLHVTCFFKDEDGTMYLGTNYSFFRYNKNNNTVSLLPNTEKDGVMNHIIDSRIVSVIKDEIDGRPVILTSPYGHFLTYYDLVQNKWVSRLDSSNIIQRFNLKDNLIRKIYKTRNGTIWMATGRTGLSEWIHHSLPKASFFDHDPTDPSSISANNVYDIAEDALGNLWVSTYGGGLNYFDVKTKKFSQIASSSNLGEGIAIDAHQNVWMISNGHLHKYDPRRKTYTGYRLPDLEKTGGVKGKIFIDREGRMYVGGTNYFTSFHPDSINAVRYEPQVYLTDFQIFNNSYSHLLSQQEIQLHHKENYFSFEFAAPDFSMGNEVRYSYKLEGFDKDWIDAGDRNYVSYPNLGGGDYVFKVRASNIPGVWTKEHASIKISIIPPYWQRAWFYVLCALLLSGAVYFVYRYRINELLKRQAIRNKIAQDLHDNVGSTLSSISVYSQVAKIYHNQHKEGELHNTLEKISTTSSEMISELNDTVWAINPRNDNMQVILQRMESFAKPLLATKGVQFVLKYDAAINTLNLEMEKRKNFYLIFKEAVNNTLKYADCKNLWVTIKQKGLHIKMKVEDDGKGFDLGKTSEGYKSSDVYGGGNGLKNMQLRAREMNGTLAISSEPGKGTTVELDFTVTRFGDRPFN